MFTYQSVHLIVNILLLIVRILSGNPVSLNLLIFFDAEDAMLLGACTFKISKLLQKKKIFT